MNNHYGATVSHIKTQFDDKQPFQTSSPTTFAIKLSNKYPSRHVKKNHPLSFLFRGFFVFVHHMGTNKSYANSRRKCWGRTQGRSTYITSFGPVRRANVLWGRTLNFFLSKKYGQLLKRNSAMLRPHKGYATVRRKADGA